MTYFLCFALGVPGVLIGAMFQNGGVFVIGVIALGMALVGIAARHEWHLYRRQSVVAHKPLQGQLRIGIGSYDPRDTPKDAR